jgi:hypothetical protein
MGKMVEAGAKIFDKLEPEPKFLTSWSWSCTKMDRLRNTDTQCAKYLLWLKPVFKCPVRGSFFFFASLPEVSWRAYTGYPAGYPAQHENY